MVKLALNTPGRQYRRLKLLLGDLDALQQSNWTFDEKLNEIFKTNLVHYRPTWMWTITRALQWILDQYAFQYFNF